MQRQLQLNRITGNVQKLILVMLLILAGAGAPGAQSKDQGSSGTRQGQSRRTPDLVVDHFELTRPSRGEVKIQVTNMGGGDAGTSTLRLIVWKAGKVAQKEAATVFAKVPALAAGRTTWIVVMAGIPIRRAKHSLSIDISEDGK